MSRSEQGVISETMAEVDARIVEDKRRSWLNRMEAAPEAPESLRERAAAEIAHEDAQALQMPPRAAAEWWEYVKDKRPESADYYRRCAARVIAVVTESALR